MYNWFLKVLFIGCSGAIVYYIRFGAPQKATYNPVRTAASHAARRSTARTRRAPRAALQRCSQPRCQWLASDGG
jgi:hypothetical protein